MKKQINAIVLGESISVAEKTSNAIVSRTLGKIHSNEIEAKIINYSTANGIATLKQYSNYHFRGVDKFKSPNSNERSLEILPYLKELIFPQFNIIEHKEADPIKHFVRSSTNKIKPKQLLDSDYPMPTIYNVDYVKPKSIWLKEENSLRDAIYRQHRAIVQTAEEAIERKITSKVVCEDKKAKKKDVKICLVGINDRDINYKVNGDDSYQILSHKSIPNKNLFKQMYQQNESMVEHYYIPRFKPAVGVRFQPSLAQINRLTKEVNHSMEFNSKSQVESFNPLKTASYDIEEGKQSPIPTFKGYSHNKKTMNEMYHRIKRSVLIDKPEHSYFEDNSLSAAKPLVLPSVYSKHKDSRIRERKPIYLRGHKKESWPLLKWE